MLCFVIKARAKNPEAELKSWILRGAQDDNDDAPVVRHLSRKVITQLDAFDPIRLASRSTFPTVGKETVAKMGGFAVVILSSPTNPTDSLERGETIFRLLRHFVTPRSKRRGLVR
jgi:hypothetical protein